MARFELNCKVPETLSWDTQKQAVEALLVPLMEFVQANELGLLALQYESVGSLTIVYGYMYGYGHHTWTDQFRFCVHGVGYFSKYGTHWRDQKKVTWQQCAKQIIDFFQAAVQRKNEHHAMVRQLLAASECLSI